MATQIVEIPRDMGTNGKDSTWQRKWKECHVTWAFRLNSGIHLELPCHYFNSFREGFPRGTNTPIPFQHIQINKCSDLLQWLPILNAISIRTQNY